MNANMNTTAVPVEQEMICDKVDRLARELSEALPHWANGQFMAMVYPDGDIRAYWFRSLSRDENGRATDPIVKAILGTLLGSGAGLLLSRAETKASIEALERAKFAPDDSDFALSELQAGIREGQSAGAAAVVPERLEDFDIYGKGAKAVGKATAALNPTLRAAHSPSAIHRSIMADLQETGFYLEKNARGEGNIAAETAMKYWDRGALGQAIADHKSIFSEGRKAGLTMTRDAFEEAVGKAMRRGDVGENEWVTQAAQSWRKKLFDPLKDEAINVKIFKPDVSVDTAPSYLSRVYKTKLMQAEEPEFKRITSDWLRGQLQTLQEAAERDASKAGKKIDIPEFVNAADREAYIKQISDDIFDRLTGRGGLGEPAYAVTVTNRGPMKERTFSIPDALIERYLESNINMVGRRYARVMGADVELARRFGSPDMADKIAEVKADYAKLREAAGGDAKTLLQLTNREKRDLNDIAGVRDILRGQYKLAQQHTNFARVLSAAQTFNYIRAMGSVMLNSLNDVARPIMVNGLGRYMSEGIVPLVTNLKAIKLAAKDAQIAGAVTERLLQSRVSTLAELADPYAANSPIERFLTNVAEKFTSATFMPHLDDFNRSMSSVLTQNRIIENVLAASEMKSIKAVKEAGSSQTVNVSRRFVDFGKLDKAERAYMGFLGIDETAASKIADMFDQHGDVNGNVHIPNLEQWDTEARQAFAAALNKDIDGTIVKKGAGDTALLFNTPVGRAFIQFKSFALASHQRVLMRGLQEDQARLFTGMISMATLGMFSFWVTSQIAGREIPDLTEDAGKWLTEGVDRSGVLSLLFEANNIFEKLGGNGVYSVASKLSTGEDKKRTASRYQSRGAWESLFGPSYGLGQDLASMLSVPMPLTHGETPKITKQDVGTARRLTPFASLPYLRWLVDGGFPLDKESGGFKGVVPWLKDKAE